MFISSIDFFRFAQLWRKVIAAAFSLSLSPPDKSVRVSLSRYLPIHLSLSLFIAHSAQARQAPPKYRKVDTTQSLLRFCCRSRLLASEPCLCFSVSFAGSSFIFVSVSSCNTRATNNFILIITLARESKKRECQNWSIVTVFYCVLVDDNQDSNRLSYVMNNLERTRTFDTGELCWASVTEWSHTQHTTLSFVYSLSL